MYFEETNLNDEKSFRSRFPLSKTTIASTMISNVADWPSQGVPNEFVKDNGLAYSNGTSLVHSEQFQLKCNQHALLATVHYCPYSKLILDVELAPLVHGILRKS